MTKNIAIRLPAAAIALLFGLSLITATTATQDRPLARTAASFTL